MLLKITPLDTLFFRNARPFNMGFETWAEWVFPPLPSTIYGALRTFLIFEHGKLSDFLAGTLSNQDEVGTVIKKGSLTLNGPFIYNEDSVGSLLFPAPADLVKVKLKEKKRKKYKLVKTSFCNVPEIFLSDYPLDKCLIFKKQLKTKDHLGFIDDISLKEYLEGKKEEFSCIEQIFKEELKIGIKRNKHTKTSEEAHIYRVPMLRLKKNICFLIEINGVKNFPNRGIFQFGGEGKTVEFEKIDNSNVFESLKDIDFELKDNMFKLYFVTPAIFEKGWLPSWINESTFEGEYKGINLKLIAVSIKKYKLVGGWNVAENRPKKMYKAVPEGSVYYFKVLNSITKERIKEIFHFKKISDEFQNTAENYKFLSKEGFGLVLVGGI